jgi:hypothetical protein
MFEYVLQPERRAALQFALHALMLFVAFLLPWPWLADMYVWAFDALANALLSLINSISPVQLHFIPPAEFAVQGSWKGSLQLVMAATGENAQTHLDVRGFSYRPLVTYLALALALPLAAQTRRRLVALSMGTLLIVSLGFVFSALPILSRLSAGGVFGKPTTLVVATAYEAIATPVMVYAIPVILFCLIIRGRLE